ncbi:MAG: hypothetical protein JEZ08_23120 [Clostridiales bacterium]|nr:hypothetical protein [Clostridiales bacterium]
MKKNVTTNLLIIILIGVMVVVVNRYYSLEASNNKVEEMLASSQREVVELKSLITVNDSAVDMTLEKLNKQIDDYESLIRKWTDYDISHNYRAELNRKSYDVEATIHTADGSFSLPKNGKIVVDSDFVELEINIVRPPNVVDKEINEIIHQYDRIFDDLRYDSYDSEAEYFVDDDTIRLKYTNLENGDKIDIFVYNELLRLLGLMDTNIQVSITNEFPSPREYFPRNIKTKVFTGGILNRGYKHNFFYTSDNSWILALDDEVSDLIFITENDQAVKAKYEYDDTVHVTEISHDGEAYTSYERTVLPEVIKLGESWNDHSRTATITAVDYPLDTPFGTLETVEVTYKNDDGYEIYLCYYAKDLGIVYKDMLSGDDALVEVEYYK